MKSGPRKIPADTIEAMREWAKANPGFAYADIAKRFDLSISYASMVLRGLCRKDRSYTPTPDRPRAKLTWEQVRAIRAAYAEGARQNALAVEYGVTTVAIHFIVIGHTWRNDPKLGKLVRVMKARHKLVPESELEEDKADAA